MNITMLINSINWVRASGHYVVVDPMNTSGLLYLNERRYQQLVITSLSNDKEIVVISTPDDNRETVHTKFGVTPGSSTPPIGDLRAKFSSMFTLRKGWKVKESMISFKGNFKGFFPTYYRDVGSWLGIKNPEFAFTAVIEFGKRMEYLRSHSNINFVILYLKVASIALNQYLAGTPVKDTGPIGKRIKMSNGLPACIPRELRSKIRQGSKLHIVIISTMLMAYKGFAGIHKKPNLSSIIASHAPNLFSISTWNLGMNSPRSKVIDSNSHFSELLDQDYDPTDYSRPTPAERLNWPDIMKAILESRSLPKREEADSLVPRFWKTFNRRGLKPMLLHAFPKSKLILTAGPNSANSILGSQIDAMIIARRKDTREIFLDYMDRANDVQERLGKSRVSDDAMLYTDITTVGNKFYTNLLLNPSYKNEWDLLWQKATRILGPLSFRYDDSICKADNLDNLIKLLPLGKLALKYESAGKVRVFAIGDYWSQMMLKPLHDSLFDVLRSHPCDATFDQIGKVKEFSKRNYSFIASYDLKSATDLIPQHLYEDVLAGWTSRSFASVWLEVLVNRRYYLLDEKNLPTFYSYTRGQPMGLLSSWASLAMVHHYLVFISASRAGFTHFSDYLVLGDDIVIANKDVAEKYTEVCKEYGITIGLPKSFVSNTGFFQFASQNVWKGEIISPLSLKEVLMCSSHSMYFGPSTALSAKMEWIARLKEREFISGNLLSSMRAIMTFSENRRFGRSLSKGIIPFDRTNTIVSILTRDFKSFVNTISIDTLLAAYRGEYGVFTNTFVHDPSARYLLLKDIVANCQATLVDLAVKAKHVSNETLWSNYALRVKGVRELLPEVSYTVVPAINEIVDAHSEQYALLMGEWRVFKAEFDALNTLEQWQTLYHGPEEGRVEFPVELVAKAFHIINRMRSLVIEKTLYTGMINRIQNVTRLAILHKSLLAKFRLSQ